MTAEQTLAQFLYEWLVWAKSPEPDNRFSKENGLCMSLFFKLESMEGGKDAGCLLTGKLNEYSSKNKVSFAYPFNDIETYLGASTLRGKLAYQNFKQETENSRMHLNPRRISWAQQTLLELDPELYKEYDK